MGLSGPVAAVILVAALLSQAGALWTAHRNAEAKAEQARDAQQRRQEAILAHHVTLANATWNATLQQVNLTVTNSGRVALDASQVDALLDGAWTTIATRRVEGRSTDVWLPDQELKLTIASASQPGDAAVITPWGLVARKAVEVA
jgi:archaellum component FlaF (FlaF/FlaG flagellin family)